MSGSRLPGLERSVSRRANGFERRRFYLLVLRSGISCFGWGGLDKRL